MNTLQNLTLNKRLGTMQSILALLIAFIGCAITMADDITPKQAMEQAQNFLQKRSAKGSWNSTTETTSLIEAGQVEGLYIFNVEGNGGFVVVANDDAVTPILGYSEKGNLDVANMPDNMRTWLKGYADEIAWARQRGSKETQQNSLDLDIESKPTIVKAPIEPMLITTWDQGNPYNQQCPLYQASDDTWEHSATGCVATAIAQVMYYTERKAGNDVTHTADKLQYTDYNENFEQQTMEIAAGTPIKWNLMQPSYDENATTSDQYTQAVSALMLYCGASVNMDYGPSSGTDSKYILGALKKYFGYNETTTMHLIRSYYSYQNWIDIMYHELAEGRPVLYIGQSSGGGHAFVADGYQGEDFFHINWGWGGLSDNYFKLSVLNPQDQGIGGYTGTNGYHYGQEAIIGIQKSDGTGSVSELVESTKVTPQLLLNSITVDKPTIALGESVNVTLKVTNQGSQTYDGDLHVIPLIGEQRGNANGKVFTIAAGETKDCVIEFTPAKVIGTGTIKLYAFTTSAEADYQPLDMNRYAELTITEATGTDNMDLTMSVNVVSAVENGHVYSPGTIKGYDITGNDLVANVTLKNETDANYAGSIAWAIYINGKKGAVNDMAASVPANSERTYEIKTNDLQYGETYVLQMAYQKDNNYDYKIIGLYTPKRALTIYNADGTKTVTSSTATSIEAPASALVVDVTGTSINEVTPNANPNTLYISDHALSGLDGKNVVTYYEGVYSAPSINLTDNEPFYSPVDVSVEKAEFSYNFTTAADGSNGWNTLMLPFRATAVTADDKNIDWFHSSGDSGKNFWLKSFANDTYDKVLFSFVSGSNIEANTPYIVAFPGSKWGEKWDMSGKAIKFIGENTQLLKTGMSTVTGSYYRFVGSTRQDATSNIYSLNADGNAFELNETAGSSPFRAYFKAATFDSAVGSLGIGSDDVTAIELIGSSEQSSECSGAPAKVIKNGKLYIGNYNIVGQQIK